MPTILITGANGFIGQHIVNRLLASKEHVVIATGKDKNRLPFTFSSAYHYYSLDICNVQEVEKLFLSCKPDVVIHAAAMGQPDYCESHKEECFQVNVLGTKNVIDACKRNDIYLLFTSTDFVFNGNNGPYEEGDLVDPVNYYGWGKVEGERLVQQSNLQYCIARLCSVYGKPLSGTNRNVVMLAKEKLSNQEYIKMVSDQIRTPTSVEDVAIGIVSLVEKRLKGIYHISGKETLTPYDMAVKAAYFFGLDVSLIEKTVTADFVQPAKRPLITGFKIGKVLKDISFDPMGYDVALEKMFGKGFNHSVKNPNKKPSCQKQPGTI